MATMRVLIVLVFGFAFSPCAIGNNAVRDCVKHTYSSQLGVRESTGRNDGQQVEQYLKAAGSSKGNAWCAAFVTWCYQICGVKAIRSAWAPAWFPSGKILWKQGRGDLPQHGDLMGLYFNEKRRIAHVGFVDEWGDKFAVTVEGNTNRAGSREGDGVYRKRRLIKQIYAVARWIN